MSDTQRSGALLPGGAAGLDVASFAVSSGTSSPEMAYELAKFLSSPQLYTSTLQSTFLAQFGLPGAYVQLQRIFTPTETGGNESLETIIKERSTDAAVGLRGTVGRWDLYATLSHSRYRINSDTPRFLEHCSNGARPGSGYGGCGCWRRCRC